MRQRCQSGFLAGRVLFVIPNKQRQNNKAATLKENQGIHQYVIYIYLNQLFLLLLLLLIWTPNFRKEMGNKKYTVVCKEQYPSRQ